MFLLFYALIKIPNTLLHIDDRLVMSPFENAN